MKTINQTVSWLTYCMAGTMTRTVVHFFPSSGGVSAPYPAHCKLTIFGQGSNATPKTVLLEGARLSQPDGLWLDDAFPELKDISGICGLFIELHTPQPKVDLGNSGCVVELHSAMHLSRFWPLLLNKEGAPERRGALPLIQDPFQTSSIVIVNGSDSKYQPSVTAMRQDRGGEVSRTAITVPNVGPHSVVEVTMPADYFEQVPAQECSFGLLRMASAALDEPAIAATGVFIMYRDAATSQPISVCAL